MRLQVGPSIDYNKVRLDFRNSPDKPSRVPSYEIEKSKADEFVKKYNKQEKKLLGITLSAIGGFSLVGWMIGLYKHSWKATGLGVVSGIALGLGVGTIISAKKKNSLMDEYDVRELSK